MKTIILTYLITQGTLLIALFLLLCTTPPTFSNDKNRIAKN
jgi:hypothetical protein